MPYLELYLETTRLLNENRTTVRYLGEIFRQCKNSRPSPMLYFFYLTTNATTEFSLKVKTLYFSLLLTFLELYFSHGTPNPQPV